MLAEFSDYSHSDVWFLISFFYFLLAIWDVCSASVIFCSNCSLLKIFIIYIITNSCIYIYIYERLLKFNRKSKSVKLIMHHWKDILDIEISIWILRLFCCIFIWSLCFSTSVFDHQPFWAGIIYAFWLRIYILILVVNIYNHYIFLRWINV